MRILFYTVLGFVFVFMFLKFTPDSRAGGAAHQVSVIRNAFKLDPQNLTIPVGDTITWTNTDERKHNLASIPGSGSTDELEIFSVLEPGAVYSHTFETPGEYPYFCFIHNQMTGKITVTK